jgi:hypothetical protein
MNFDVVPLDESTLVNVKELFRNSFVHLARVCVYVSAVD